MRNFAGANIDTKLMCVPLRVIPLRKFWFHLLTVRCQQKDSFRFAFINIHIFVLVLLVLLVLLVSVNSPGWRYQMRPLRRDLLQKLYSMDDISSN